MPKRALFATLLALVLAACSATPTQLQSQKLPARTLAAPAAVPAREFQQLLIAHFQNREAKMLVAGRITAQGVDLTALTPEGVPLFDVHFDGNTARIEKQIGVPDGLSPQSILEDLQLVFWPLASLNELWSHTPAPQWQVSSSATGRELIFGEQHIVDVTSAIDPWSAPVELQHRLYGYHLSITTLSQRLLP